MHTNLKHLRETTDTCSSIEVGAPIEEVSERDCSVIGRGKVTAITVLDPTNPLSDILTYETADRYVFDCRRYQARPVGTLTLYEGYWEAPGVWSDRVARLAEGAN